MATRNFLTLLLSDFFFFEASNREFLWLDVHENSLEPTKQTTDNFIWSSLNWCHIVQTSSLWALRPHTEVSNKSIFGKILGPIAQTQDPVSDMIQFY